VFATEPKARRRGHAETYPEVPHSVVTLAPSFRSSRTQKHSPRSLEECANSVGHSARRSTNRREVNQVLKIYEKLASYRVDEEGQTMAEYGVVLAVITIAVFGALGLLSGNIVNAVTRVATYIT
jgi:Flp pilus assembly pilin Flp